MSRIPNKWRIPLILTIFSLLLLAVALPFATAAEVQEADGVNPAAADSPTSAAYSHRLIVQLDSPPLVKMAEGRAEFARLADGRLDVNSSQARAYIAQLEAEQAAFVSRMATVLPEASVASYINENNENIAATYQILFNGVAVDPGKMETAAARKQLAEMDGVKAVFRDFKHYPDMYASLPLINAPAVWAQNGGRDNAGDGVKVASMDGGAHHEAPMFDGAGFSYPTDPPFNGSGLGDAANNNGKIIASRAYFRPFDPPAPGDENTWPGENGTSHGTHTSSTAAGNTVVADYLGITETVSGVAPGAWIMSYRVFYASVLGDASFHTVEGIAALEDIVMDGADVLNNSWGGGPGSAGGEFDPLDTALINAAEAGIFVSMSAGNAGPGNGTTDHPSPDYINVAASTTSGTYASGLLNVIAPEPISPTLQEIGFGTALFGDPLPVGQVITYSYVTAASVDPGNFDGCDPWTGTPFAGEAAVISRGSCNFSDKVYYAEQAGAEFVVVYNNDGDDVINMACGSFCGPGEITISSVFVGQTHGEGMVSWYDTHGASAVLELNTLAFQLGNTPDRIASFSSRGPGVGNVLKPDIAAPGVNILAQGYQPGVSGEARHLGYGQVSGTSMAAPHVAGAAANLRQIHPGWSNADIKSALMSTSKYMDIYNSDGTPAQPLDMGAGRLDLTNAADPGLILDPPSLSYGMMPTGTAKALQVTVTSVATATETYTLSSLYTGNGFAPTQTTSLPGFSIAPAAISVAPGGTATFTVTFDSAQGMGIGDNQGYIIMEGDGSHHAHMPAWARVAPPPAAADVLIIDNDFSFLYGLPDYRWYYTSTLEELGLSYEIWHADGNYANPTTIPDAANLSAYKAIIYYTGDNYFPDGAFTVQTPLTALDMNRLTEYANNGGILIAMGQDMAAVLDSAETDGGNFFYSSVLGGNWLQDSVSAYNLPDQAVAALPEAPEALQNVSIDLSGPDSTVIDLSGANEVPPIATTTSGEAATTYVGPSQEVWYDITITAGDPVSLTAAHIHSATVDANGGVIHPIWPFTQTQYVTDTLSWSGMVTLSDDEAAALMNGNLYYNVHSTDNPAGEVRGQIIVPVSGDGAGNQYYVDEIATDPGSESIPAPGVASPYMPLLQYPGMYNEEDGVVAMAHRAQPTLEYPGMSYYGRSIYTTFGLEGVNNGLGTTSRAELLGAMLDWAMDEPTVIISDVTGAYDGSTPYTMFEATMMSNITGTTGVSYRWDFGDGSEYMGPTTNNMASHQYEFCGPYTVRVEATDSWGNTAIGEVDVNVANCSGWPVYLPLTAKP